MGLKNFMRKVKEQILAGAPPFDPSVFEHPLSSKTDWTPKARGGANFKTKKLVQESATLLYYKGSKMMLIFGLIFAIFPLLFLIPTVILNSEPDMERGSFVYLFTIIPLIFCFVGVMIIVRSRRKLYFDKSAGYLYTGRKKAMSSLQTTAKKGWIPLEDIKALQIIKERVSSKNGSYLSYEINAVFEDGERHNIIDHGKYDPLITDATIIAHFLHIPCWNGVDGSTIHPETNTTDAYESKGNYDTPIYDAPKTTAQDLDEEYDSLKPRKL